MYDYPETKEEAYGVTVLPDGGYAVCGRVNGTGNIEGQAWILRTDANGDTLWTDVWGEARANWGKSVLFSNEMICVLTFGYDDTLTTLGTHLLFYDLDGTYIHGTEDVLLTSEHPAAFVDASDGGYTLVTSATPEIVHTDSLGEILWWYTITVSPVTDQEGYGIRTTMDDGYVFCGWDGKWLEPRVTPGCNAPIAESDTGSTEDGWLVRFDSEGNELWNFRNEMGHDNHFYSVVQLPEGGYIAAGTYTGSGYLVRYTPETGIDEGAAPPLSTLSASPNPFNSAVAISFSLTVPSEVRLSVYDLAGRRIDDLWVGSSPAGEHALTWAPGSSIPAGCYLVVLHTPVERQVRKIVRL